MASNQGLLFLLFLILAGLSGSSSTSISHDAFECHGLTGRNLLQAQSSCPVNFENQNYTIVTSKCKGPNYPTKVCCDALKQFACPFSKEINDMKNDCATTMFSYINIYGKYPPGLFANMCRGDKDGLTCSDDDSTSGAAFTRRRTIPLALIASAVFPFVFLQYLL